MGHPLCYRIGMPLRPACLLPVLIAAALELAPPPPQAPAAPANARFEPAPTPSGPYPRRGSGIGSLEMPIPPKMPLGTGAVPVSNSAARGSIVTGIRQSF